MSATADKVMDGGFRRNTVSKLKHRWGTQIQKQLNKNHVDQSFFNSIVVPPSHNMRNSKSILPNFLLSGNELKEKKHHK